VLSSSPLVSIHVLSYKNTEYLCECLDSIFSQTYDNIELIVSNDGADNFDIGFVTSYAKRKKKSNIKNLIVNKNEYNVGTVKHCNIALDLSNSDGQYVMFIACDDSYNNENVIKDMINGFNRVPKDVESIVGQTGMYDKDMKSLLGLYVTKKDQKLINKLTPYELYRTQLVHRPLLPAASTIYKRSVFEKYGRFDEKYFLIEDWTSSFKFARQGMRTYYLDIMCVNHRDGGVSHSKIDPTSFAHKMYIQDWMNGLGELLNDTSIDKNTKEKIKEKWIYRRKMYHDTFKPILDVDKSLDNEDKLFSVVILCYENFHMLPAAVRSILTQRHAKIEVIISDDASNYFDEQYIINIIAKHISDCKENGESCNIERYKILRNPQNLGTVKNLKSAMKEVTGDFYITLGADDELHDSSVLSSFASTFAIYGDNLWWICGLSSVRTPDNLTHINDFPTAHDEQVLLRRDPVELYSLWSGKYASSTPGMAFRRGVADLVGGYDSGYVYIEDWPLVLKLLRKEILPVYIKKYTVKHATGGISQQNTVNGLNIRRKWMEERRRFYSIEIEPYLGRLLPHDLKEYRRNLAFMDKVIIMDLGFYQYRYKAKLKMLLTDFRVVKWASIPYVTQIKTKFYAATNDRYRLISLGFISFIAAIVGQYFGDNVFANVFVIFGYILSAVLMLSVFIRMVGNFASKFISKLKHFYNWR